MANDPIEKPRDHLSRGAFANVRLRALTDSFHTTAC
jgi:hypothetical protein